MTDRCVYFVDREREERERKQQVLSDARSVLEELELEELTQRLFSLREGNIHNMSALQLLCL